MSMYASPASDDRSESPDPAEDESQDETSGQAAQQEANPTEPKNNGNNSNAITSVPNLDSLNHLRSVGHSNAVCWELSSAKPGNGVEQLRDPSTETYWQSDGTTQPHWVELTFARRIRILYVALYLDYQLDESYTPKTISIETGMTTQDLSAAPENRVMELQDPVGWCIFPVVTDPGTKTHLLRLSILSMHQNGRDTHVRSVAVFAEPMRRSVVDSVVADENTKQQQLAPHPGAQEDVEEKEWDHKLPQPSFETNPFSFQIR